MSDPLLNEYNGLLQAVETLQRKVSYLERIAAAIPGAGGLIFALLQDEKLTAAQASFDFDGIPQSYKHLWLIGNLRGDTAATLTNNLMRLNNVSSANYYDQSLTGSAATASAAETLAQTSAIVGRSNAGTAQANTMGTLCLLIRDYTEPTRMPGGAYLNYYNAALTTGNFAARTGGFLLNVAGAVTRVTLTPAAGNWDVDSRLSLYGIP